MPKGGSSQGKLKQRSRARLIIRVVSLGLVGLAVARELQKPAGERDWRGRLWFIPYDLRPPTPSRVRGALWNPDEPVLTARPFGVGWVVNLGRVYRLWSERRSHAA